MITFCAICQPLVYVLFLLKMFTINHLATMLIFLVWIVIGKRVGGSWDGYWLTESLLHDGDAFSGGLAY